MIAADVIERLNAAVPSWPGGVGLVPEDTHAFIVAGQWKIGPFSLREQWADVVTMTDKRGRTTSCATVDQVVDAVLERGR